MTVNSKEVGWAKARLRHAHRSVEFERWARFRLRSLSYGRTWSLSPPTNGTENSVFDNLSEKLGGILDRLTRRGSLTEADVDASMREVRRALLEADVSLDVVRSFTEKVREQAIGATVVKSVTPGQMVVKIVHDELIATLGSDGQTIDLNGVPPVAIMMVGLQGSGKTTTTAKLARRLTQRDRRKVLMASLDIYRPAAMEQLA